MSIYFRFRYVWHKSYHYGFKINWPDIFYCKPRSVRMSLIFWDEWYRMAEINQSKATNSATFCKFSLRVNCTEFSRSFFFCFSDCYMYSLLMFHNPLLFQPFLKIVASVWFINFFHLQYHWLLNLASVPFEWICESLYFMIFHFSTCLSEIEILFYKSKKFSFNPFSLCFFTDAIPDSRQLSSYLHKK